MKNVFNIKIFKEFFKQLKVIGLLMAIITGFIAALMPISTYIGIRENQKNIALSQSIVSIDEIILVFFIIFCITVPMLTLSAFQFLNKRNTCDFYHSIPHKRTCLFFSIFAAVFSWIFINLASTTLIFSILYTAFKKYIIFDISQLLLASVNILIISLLVCSAIILACTLTGNILNNFFVSGIILFLPRIFITLFASLITNSIPFIQSFDTISVFKNSTNLLFGIFLNFLSIGSSKYYYHLGFGTVYTLILSIIYITLAVFVFKIRKSEVAGNSSINTKLQAIFRICIGIFITLPAIIAVFGELSNQSSYEYNGSLLFYVIANVIIAIIFMFIYELVSTKNIKKALHSLIFIPVHLAACAALIGFIFGIYNFSLNYVPAKDDVEYIHICNYAYDDESYKDYFEYKISTSKIYDKNIINTLLETLEDNIEKFKENPDKFYYSSNNINITFVCNGKEYNRTIYLDYKNSSNITSQISKAIDLNSILLDFPNIANSQISTSGNLEFLNKPNNDIFVKKLYNTFLECVKNNPDPYLSYMKKNIRYSLLTAENDYLSNVNNDEDSDFDYNVSFVVTTFVNGAKATAYIPIITDYEPVMELLYNESLKNEAAQLKVKDILSNINDYIYKYDEISIYVSPARKNQSNDNAIYFTYSNKTIFYEYNYGYTACTPEELKAAKDALQIASEEDVKKLKYIGDNINTNAYDSNYSFYTVAICYEQNYSDNYTSENLLPILVAIPN